MSQEERRLKSENKVYQHADTLFGYFLEKVKDNGEAFGDIKIDFKGKIQQEKVQRSLEIVKQKFQAKQKIDPLRSLDKLGIDLIISNKDLLDQFESKINTSLSKLDVDILHRT